MDIANECHDGSNPNNFDGDVTIDGLPEALTPTLLTTLRLLWTLHPEALQKVALAVAVDGSNVNAGDL